MMIAFTGELKSGKDFLCQFLVDNYKAKRLSFSDEVRRLTQKVFKWMPFDFNPAVKDLPFDHPQNPYGLTPRDIWLLMGKVRDVDPKYFVNAFDDNNEEFLGDPNTLYIITDFRTPDEWEWLQKHNVPVIKIELENRDGLPSSAFEEFVRHFKEYDALFINNMNGTEEFDKFFKEFYDKQTAN